MSRFDCTFKSKVLTASLHYFNYADQYFEHSMYFVNENIIIQNHKRPERVYSQVHLF